MLNLILSTNVYLFLGLALDCKLSMTQNRHQSQFLLQFLVEDSRSIGEVIYFDLSLAIISAN